MGRLKKMKSIKILSIIIFFLSIISCSLRTIKSKSKNKRKNKSKTKAKPLLAGTAQGAAGSAAGAAAAEGAEAAIERAKAASLRAKAASNPPTKSNFEGSELEAAVRILSKKMCLKWGKAFTYNFFGNVGNWLEGLVDDDSHYRKIFGDTFSVAFNDNTVNRRTLEKSIMFTMENAIGGTGAHTQPMEFWKQYSEDMQRQNGEYLNGLVRAAQTKSAFYKAQAQGKETKGNIENAQDVAELGANVFKEGPKKAFGDYIEGGASNVMGAGEAMKWINNIAITVAQTYIMHEANSVIFNDEGVRQAKTEFARKLINKSGACGDVLQENESFEYAPAPKFWGDLAALD